MKLGYYNKLQIWELVEVTTQMKRGGKDLLLFFLLLFNLFERVYDTKEQFIIKLERRSFVHNFVNNFVKFRELKK